MCSKRAHSSSRRFISPLLFQGYSRPLNNGGEKHQARQTHTPSELTVHTNSNDDLINLAHLSHKLTRRQTFLLLAETVILAQNSHKNSREAVSPVWKYVQYLFPPLAKKKPKTEFMSHQNTWGENKSWHWTVNVKTQVQLRGGKKTNVYWFKQDLPFFPLINVLSESKTDRRCCDIYCNLCDYMIQIFCYWLRDGTA